jgi:hypothetical protein
MQFIIDSIFSILLHKNHMDKSEFNYSPAGLITNFWTNVHGVSCYYKLLSQCAHVLRDNCAAHSKIATYRTFSSNTQSSALYKTVAANKRYGECENILDLLRLDRLSGRV